MNPNRLRCGRAGAALAAALLAGALAAPACTSTGRKVPEGIVQPDKYLFERGTEDLQARRWLRSREYFRQLLDSYPQSAYRPDAKLALGDAYLGEGSAEALVLSQNEFREFLTFYPTHKRADYAQYKLGMTHFKQMSNPERDQTQTREAIGELQSFVDRYPNSTLMDEVKGKLREARDRLSDSEYRVGFFYYRVKWYPGAIDRLNAVIRDDPGYTRRDAAFFYLAESLATVERTAEALPYFDRILKECPTSSYRAKAQQRVDEIKNAPPKPQAPTKK